MRRIFVVGLAIGVWMGAVPARGATLTVDDDRAECARAGFASVQAAVDAASSGDQITVCKGYYREQVRVPSTKSGLLIESSPRLTARLRAPKLWASPPRAVVVLAGAGTTLRGFRILGPLPSPWPNCDASALQHEAGVQIGADRVVVADNQITSMFDDCGSGAGVWAGDAQNELGENYSADDALVADNRITMYGWSGVVVEGVEPSAQPRIERNLLFGSRGLFGIMQAQDGSFRATDNTIRLNAAYGVVLGGGDQAGPSTLVGNRIGGNGRGILELDGGGAMISRNVIYANRGDGITYDPYYGNGEISENVVRKNGHGLNFEGSASSSVGPTLVRANHVVQNGQYGIDVTSPGYDFNNNYVRGNGGYDCRDTTGPGGPEAFGLFNRWRGNTGEIRSFPAGICQPEPVSRASAERADECPEVLAARLEVGVLVE